MAKSATMDAVTQAVKDAMSGAETDNPLVRMVAPFVSRAHARQVDEMKTEYPSPAATALLAVKLFKEETHVIV